MIVIKTEKMRLLDEPTELPEPAEDDGEDDEDWEDDNFIF